MPQQMYEKRLQIAKSFLMKKFEFKNHAVTV